MLIAFFQDVFKCCKDRKRLFQWRGFRTTASHFAVVANRPESRNRFQMLKALQGAGGAVSAGCNAICPHQCTAHGTQHAAHGTWQ